MKQVVSWLGLQCKKECFVSIKDNLEIDDYHLTYLIML